MVGCVDTPATIAVSPTAGPGPTLIEPEKAGALFAKACVNTSPRFSGIKTVLADGSFLQNAATKTYYSQTFNLSFNANKDRCSMVFRAGLPDAEVISGLARGTNSIVSAGDLPRNIAVTSSQAADGGTYFRMVLPGKQ